MTKKVNWRDENRPREWNLQNTFLRVWHTVSADVMEIDRRNENLQNTILRVWHTISADNMEIDRGNENLQNTLCSGVHISLIEYDRY